MQIRVRSPHNSKRSQILTPSQFELVHDYVIEQMNAGKQIKDREVVDRLKAAGNPIIFGESELTKVQRTRWKKAKELFQSIKDRATDDVILMYETTIIKKEDILIDETEINIRLSPTCQVNWFILDTDMDHGLYTKIKDYEADVRSRFKLMKNVEF
jgi:hypothetical protein